MNELTFPIVFMLAVVVAEGLVIAKTQKGTVSWQELVFNLNSGHIMLWLFRGLEIFCYGFVVTHYSFNLVENWPTALVWVFAILAWDFGFYWLHRLHHTYRVLWAVHVVHHQGEHYNLSLGVHNSWYSSLTSIPFFMLLALMGIPLEVFITVSILHYTIQFFNHSALIPRLGWLEKFMVTPQHHRVHHVKEGHYSNRNFGGSFIFWDKLFGTFSKLPETEHHFGIKGAPASENPFIDSNLPFWRIIKRRSQPKAKPAPLFRVNQIALVMGTLLLFSLVIGYVYIYGYGYQGTTQQQVILFILLALGTVALSGISDGRKIGLLSWFFIACLLLICILFIWQWTTPFWVIFTSALWLHSLLMLIGIGRKPIQVSDVF
ncbi:sterol desaturase family protein [Providencia huaxiensis]|uniref:sterol desaturase family protein n=1 Tax=Providencia huaxiensis TaxID=2027290 RepID=UPI0032DBA25A